MRIRTIKPDYWTHRMHRRISEAASLLGAALLNLADDEGRFEADGYAIACALFPKRPLSKPVDECLAELAAVGYLVIYSARLEGEDIRLAQIVNFKRHQCINKPRKSTLPPAPPKLLQDASRSDTVALPEQSEFPDGIETGSETVELPGEGRKEGKEKKEGTRAREHSHSSAEIPSVEEVVTYGSMGSAVDEAYCRYWHEKAETDHRWIKNGQLIDWRRDLNGWWGADKEKWMDGTHARSPLKKMRAAQANGQTGKINREELVRERDDLRSRRAALGNKEKPESEKLLERIKEISRLLGEG
jgi:hypothetical protein